MDQPNENERDPAQVKAMTEIADKIINGIGRGQLEVDVCNACMLVIQLICDNSEDPNLGEAAVPSIHALGQHLLKRSVARQVLQQVSVTPVRVGDPLEPDGQEHAMPRGKKTYLN
jgi:hypothetical protein